MAYRVDKEAITNSRYILSSARNHCQYAACYSYYYYLFIFCRIKILIIMLLVLLLIIIAVYTQVFIIVFIYINNTRYNRIHEIHILLLNINYMYNEIKPLSSVQHTKKTHNTQRTPTLTHMSQLTPVY